MDRPSRRRRRANFLVMVLAPPPKVGVLDSRLRQRGRRGVACYVAPPSRAQCRGAPTARESSRTSTATCA